MTCCVLCQTKPGDATYEAPLKYVGSHDTVLILFYSDGSGALANGGAPPGDTVLPECLSEELGLSPLARRPPWGFAPELREREDPAPASSNQNKAGVSGGVGAGGSSPRAAASAAEARRGRWTVRRVRGSGDRNMT